MRLPSVDAIAIAWLLVSATAPGAIVTIGASKDNTIFQHNALHSAGGAAGLRAGTNGMGSPRRGLIAFDIAGNLPAGSTITGIELRLYLGDSSPGSQNVRVHRVFKDWGEGTAGSDNPSLGGTGMGSPAEPGDATWSHAMLDTVTWTAPGANGDFNSIASTTASIGDVLDSPYFWSSTPALVTDVQNWLDAPSTNFGWALINAHEETIRSQKVFYSRDATQTASGEPGSLDPSWRPSLTITYVTTAAPDGDYNGDGFVDAADYPVWRKTLNFPVTPDGSGADGNQSGMIDDGDYDYWRRRFGTASAGSGSRESVPEPATALMLAFALPLAVANGRR
jgi:hypothetical protein